MLQNLSLSFEVDAVTAIYREFVRNQCIGIYLSRSLSECLYVCVRERVCECIGNLYENHGTHNHVYRMSRELTELTDDDNK